eukprot:scaffold112069_cov69-Phaeocystis_antarctica.AAC.2
MRWQPASPCSSRRYGRVEGCWTRDVLAAGLLLCGLTGLGCSRALVAGWYATNGGTCDVCHGPIPPITSEATPKLPDPKIRSVREKIDRLLVSSRSSQSTRPTLANCMNASILTALDCFSPSASSCT